MAPAGSSTEEGGPAARAVPARPAVTQDLIEQLAGAAGFPLSPDRRLAVAPLFAEVLAGAARLEDADASAFGPPPNAVAPPEPSEA